MSGKRLPSWRFKGTWVKLMVQSNLDYPDSLGTHEIVRIIENMNINEQQNPAKLIKFRKQHLIVKHQFYKSFGIQNTIWSASSFSSFMEIMDRHGDPVNKRL